MSQKMSDDLRELAHADAITEARLLLEEMREVLDTFRHLLLNYDSMTEILRAREDRLVDAIEQLRGEVDRLRADSSENRRLLNLFTESHRTGEDQWENQTKRRKRGRLSSSHSDTLERFAKSTN